MRTLRLLPALLTLPATLALADTIKLKSGETLEGRIVQFDPTGLTIEVQYSPTIVEQRFIPKADIASSSVASSDEAAYAAIAKITPPETAMEVSAYDVILTEKLRPFLKQYPASPRAADVKALIARFEAERKRLAAGDIKVAGVWYDPAAYAEAKYQIDAARILLALQAQMQAKNYPAVLNSFEALKRLYPGSLAYAGAVPLVVEALPKFDQQLTFTLRNLPATLAQRQATIDRTPVEQRAPVAQAIANENARAEAAQKAAERAQQRFFPLLAYDSKGLATMQTSARDLAKQLAAIDAAKLTAAAALVRQTQAALDRGDTAAATTSLERLKVAWPQYEGLRRLELRLKTAEATPSPSPDPAVGAEKKL